MSGYEIFSGAGSLSINVKTIDVRLHSSLYLIGQGIPNYGGMIAQDLLWLLENFSNATPPPNPLIGQLWHDRTHNRETFFNGIDWLPLLTSGNSFSNLFDMLPAATNIDFTVAGTTTIFTGTGNRYYPITVVLIPHGNVNATVGPTFNLFTTLAGDILPSTTIDSMSSTSFSVFFTVVNTGTGFTQTTASGDGVTVNFFTQNLSQTARTITSVTIDGIMQIPDIDYTVLSLSNHQSYVQFGTAPSAATRIMIIEAPVNQSPQFVAGTDSINLAITSAATGGQLRFDAFIFGFTQ